MAYSFVRAGPGHNDLTSRISPDGFACGILASNMGLELAGQTPGAQGAEKRVRERFPVSLVARGARRSADWEAPGGSLFRRGRAGWTGPPDRRPPGPSSERGTGSAVFRLLTRRDDFGDVDVSFWLFHRALLEDGPGFPAAAWDGVHVLLRYRGPDEHYALSVHRRDDSVVIKRKAPDGRSAGGRCAVLAGPTPRRAPFGSWTKIRVRARDEEDGAVSLALFADERLLASARDDGSWGPPLRGTGKVGLRGDNAEFSFADFEIAATPDTSGGTP